MLLTDLTSGGAKILSNFPSSSSINFLPIDPSDAECTASQRAASVHLPEVDAQSTLALENFYQKAFWFNYCAWSKFGNICRFLHFQTCLTFEQALTSLYFARRLTRKFLFDLPAKIFATFRRMSGGCNCTNGLL